MMKPISNYYKLCWGKLKFDTIVHSRFTVDRKDLSRKFAARWMSTVSKGMGGTAADCKCGISIANGWDFHAKLVLDEWKCVLIVCVPCLYLYNRHKLNEHTLVAIKPMKIGLRNRIFCGNWLARAPACVCAYVAYRAAYTEIMGHTLPQLLSYFWSDGKRQASS